MEKRSSPNGALPQLTCELCRERKVKCDKLVPCTNCLSAGVVCVPVQRLRMARGRHVRNRDRSSVLDEDLKRRVRRLEALIKAGGGASLPEQLAPNPTSSGAEAPLNAAGNHQPEKRAILMQQPAHFWADLAEEIHGLRDVLESAPNNETDAEDDAGLALEPEQVETTMFNSVHRGISVLGLSEPSSHIFQQAARVHPTTAQKLCQVYLQQVDPIIKILHRPSLGNFMLHGGGYLGYQEGHPSTQVLSAAVSYAAAGSMTENQCQKNLHTGKSSIVADCRRACEAALERSGLLYTRDVTVLQAFVLYLVARHCEERSRAVWTLFAVAVRIAKALSLNLDPRKVPSQRRETFFEQETRKRLWLTICMLDVQVSIGMTSQPLIAVDEAMAGFKDPPRHVNDADFDQTTTHPVAEREGLTDTTYAIIKYKLQLLGRLTLFGAQDSPQSETKKSWDNNDHAVKSDMQSRQQHVECFEQEILGLMRLCDPESSTYAWFTLHSAQCFLAGARAIVLRPLQRLREGSQPPPPRVRGNTELLQLTAKVLEKAVLAHTDARGEGFRWSVTIPWHVLAITIAECYICADDASGDTDVADIIRRVWPTVEGTYRIHEDAVAVAIGSTSCDRLQGPMRRLIKRTREKLATILEMRPNNSSQSGATSSNAPGMASSASMTGLDANSVPSFEVPTSMLEDPAWGIWEEFVSGISFDDFGGPDPLFFSGENT
ncbi:hypothetical protein B0H63DRAFT_521378 [Podospora didyma]|uniref:Zn(2)-C6 fungal-type domain-containing protein n=1 Tax=Podospora didyma TaxID=330526 RepID=A0AAE0NTG6_9PEZI|nr:hypothetical protein B0H63DRAFT_521378 [Podospora didyma]